MRRKFGHCRAGTASQYPQSPMKIQTKETTRDNVTLARFGGRTWEVIGRHYDTVTLRDGNLRIYVRADQIEPVGVIEEPAPEK